MNVARFSSFKDLIIRMKQRTSWKNVTTDKLKTRIKKKNISLSETYFRVQYMYLRYFTKYLHCISRLFLFILIVNQEKTKTEL